MKHSAVVGGVVGVAFLGSAAAPAVAGAAECGAGTVYDPPSDTCVVAPAAPAPADWNAPPPLPGPAMPPLPPLSICPPIPFVPVCFPLN
ncbi:MAG: hypothetical protein KDB45_10240 [Mycobacterium sp.]|nr:hypothetical protein [Mycobacterium sp.]